MPRGETTTEVWPEGLCDLCGGSSRWDSRQPFELGSVLGPVSGSKTDATFGFCVPSDNVLRFASRQGVATIAGMDAYRCERLFAGADPCRHWLCRGLEIKRMADTARRKLGQKVSNDVRDLSSTSCWPAGCFDARSGLAP